jgi:general secretion pathway protein A
LDAEETERYIRQRLQIAGGNLQADPLFSAQTIAAVYRHSQGLPRLINTICDNALITAYVRRLPSVTPDVIENVAKEFRLNVVYSPAAEKGDSSNELHSQQVTTLIQQLYAALGRPASSNSDSALTVETSKT